MEKNGKVKTIWTTKKVKTEEFFSEKADLGEVEGVQEGDQYSCEISFFLNG